MLFNQMADFSEILGEIRTGVVTLAQATIQNYVDAAVEDAEDFIGSTEGKLKRWTGLLADGSLTTEDFEWLVRSQADLAQMRALKRSGLALVRVDEFKSSLLNLVTDTVFRFVL